MKTSAKLQAIDTFMCNFYPEETVNRFKKLCNYKDKNLWLKKIQTCTTLSTYIQCLDLHWYGNVDIFTKAKRALLEKNGITPRRLECYFLLNLTLLEDTIAQTEQGNLLKYYRLLLYLNNGTAIFERTKLYQFVHNLEAKIIANFAAEPKFDGSMRNFLLIVALFANSDMKHTNETRKTYHQLCQMCNN